MPTDTLVREADVLDRELAGLDHLELAGASQRSVTRGLWSAVWPKLTAVLLFVGVWQLVFWSGWRPEFLLPSPATAFGELWDEMQTVDFWRAVGTTMRRAIFGYAVAVVIGGAIGIAVTRVRSLRIAIGSMISGLQTMPSVAWFPLAILLFGLDESAIMFVVVLGAAPSIANGIISGIDNVPPILRRVGTAMGARGVALYRDVIVPAAMPSMISGLKQGWAFSWRSLMAGELLVLIPGTQSIGSRLEYARQFSDAPSIIANMIVIFTIGVLVDALVFGRIERTVLRRHGLAVSTEGRAAKLLRRRELTAATVGR
jgi:NitT/TauT family transport system permease protein